MMENGEMFVIYTQNYGSEPVFHKVVGSESEATAWIAHTEATHFDKLVEPATIAMEKWLYSLEHEIDLCNYAPQEYHINHHDFFDEWSDVEAEILRCKDGSFVLDYVRQRTPKYKYGKVEMDEGEW